MSRTSKAVQIKDVEGNEHLWELEQRPAGEGILLGFELVELAGTVMVNVIGNKSNAAAAASAISGIVQQITTAGGLTLIRKVLGYAKRGKKKILFPGDPLPTSPDELEKVVAFNNVFRGNYGELRRVLVEVLQFEFSSFFDDWSETNPQTEGTVQSILAYLGPSNAATSKV